MQFISALIDRVLWWLDPTRALYRNLQRRGLIHDSRPDPASEAFAVFYRQMTIEWFEVEKSPDCPPNCRSKDKTGAWTGHPDDEGWCLKHYALWAETQEQRRLLDERRKRASSHTP